MRTNNYNHSKKGGGKKKTKKKQKKTIPKKKETEKEKEILKKKITIMKLIKDMNEKDYKSYCENNLLPVYNNSGYIYKEFVDEKENKILKDIKATKTMIKSEFIQFKKGTEVTISPTKLKEVLKVDIINNNYNKKLSKAIKCNELLMNFLKLTNNDDAEIKKKLLAFKEFINYPHAIINSSDGIKYFYNSLPPDYKEFIELKLLTFNNEDSLKTELYKLCAEIIFWSMNTLQLEKISDSPTQKPYITSLELDEIQNKKLNTQRSNYELVMI